MFCASKGAKEGIEKEDNPISASTTDLMSDLGGNLPEAFL